MLVCGAFRRQKEPTGFSFCLESEWVGGQRVDRSGKGLLQVWKRQIQQLNRVSQDVASAILAAYPSPRLLRKVRPLQARARPFKGHFVTSVFTGASRWRSVFSWWERKLDSSLFDASIFTEALCPLLPPTVLCSGLQSVPELR